MNFLVLILGTDPNSYYMARCVYEAFKIKPYVIGKKPLLFTSYSNILQVSYNENMWDEKAFITMLNSFAKDKKDKILLISTNETYTEFVSKNKDKIDKKFVYNFPSIEVIRSLTNKENFYKTYKNHLDFAKTIYYDFKEKLDYQKINYPVVVKPANVVLYNHVNFEGKNKIYKIKNKEELDNILNIIKNSGYNDTMIIQDFIPGGDDYLFDSVLYVNKNGKCEFASLAQIGLQERTKGMVGNAAVLINGFNTFGLDGSSLINLLRKFLEQINYRGFAEVDLKYDMRDKTFKILEINARQGRSSYYLTALGKNLAQVLVDDLIKNETHDFEYLDKEVLLSFVPKGIVKRYVDNEEYKKEVLRLWKKVVRPMHFKGDKNFKRYLMLKKRDLNYYREYKNSYWK